MRISNPISASLLATLCLVHTSEQPPQRGQGAQRGVGGQQAMNQARNRNMKSDAAQMGAFNQLGANDRVGHQGNQRPPVDQLAHMMLANFDADASGALDQDELQMALATMMQQMQMNRMPQGGQVSQQSMQMRTDTANQPQSRGQRVQRSRSQQRSGGGSRPPKALPDRM